MVLSAGIRVHAKPESAFTFRQNDRSRQARIRNTSDAIGIGGATPQQITIATLPDGNRVTVNLTTTRSRDGGVRWLHICPDCEKCKGAPYVSDAALRCRQCAGIH